MIPKTNTAPGRSPAGGGMFLGNASLPRNAHAPRGRPSPKAHCSIEISDIRCGIPFGDDFEIIFQAIRFRKQPDKLEFVRMSTAQCLPPGGRGTAKRWMRNGDTFPFSTRSRETVQPFLMYLFDEMHIDSEHIAVPHPPQCAHWGTFPPGEGIAFRHTFKHLFIRQRRKTDMHKN